MDSSIFIFSFPCIFSPFLSSCYTLFLSPLFYFPPSFGKDVSFSLRLSLVLSCNGPLVRFFLVHLYPHMIFGVLFPPLLKSCFPSAPSFYYFPVFVSHFLSAPPIQLRLMGVAFLFHCCQFHFTHFYFLFQESSTVCAKGLPSNDNDWLIALLWK